MSLLRFSDVTFQYFEVRFQAEYVKALANKTKIICVTRLPPGDKLENILSDLG